MHMLTQPQTEEDVSLLLGEREALALLSHEPERRDHFREACAAFHRAMLRKSEAEQPQEAR